MAILWIIQKHKDSMEILLMNSMDKKKGLVLGLTWKYGLVLKNTHK